jgi:hypothetical protein
LTSRHFGAAQEPTARRYALWGNNIHKIKRLFVLSDAVNWRPPKALVSWARRLAANRNQDIIKELCSIFDSLLFFSRPGGGDPAECIILIKFSLLSICCTIFPIQRRLEAGWSAWRRLVRLELCPGAWLSEQSAKQSRRCGFFPVAPNAGAEGVRDAKLGPAIETHLSLGLH